MAGGCFQDVLDYFKNEKQIDVDPAVISNIVSTLESLKKAGNNDTREFAKSLKKLLDDYERKFALESKAFVDNKVKYAKLKEFISNASSKDKAKAIENLLVGGIDAMKSGNKGVDQVRIAKFERWASGFHGRLQELGLDKVFASRSLDREITVALFEMDTRGNVGDIKGIPKQAIQIAEEMRRVQNQMVGDLNGAGANIVELIGYVQRQVHDGTKIAQVGRDKWKADIRSALDENKTFRGESEEGINKILNELYDEFRNGFHETASLDSPESTLSRIVSRKANLAERLGRSRSLHFKSGEAFFDYNLKYGRNSVGEAMLRSFEANSQAYALLDKFGTNPRAAFDKAVDQALKDIRSDASLSDLEKQAVEKRFRSAQNIRARENQWKQVTGQNTVYSRNLLSNIVNLARSANSWALLKNVTPRSFTDLGTAASVLKSQNGKNFLQSLAEVNKTYIDLLPPSNRKFWARELGFAVGNINHSIYRKMGLDDTPGMVSRINDIYYKYTGLTAHTDAVKIATARIVAADAAKHSETDFAKLDSSFKENLSRYDIGEVEWGIMRDAVKTITEDGSNSKVITPDSIDELPVEAFTAGRNRANFPGTDAEYRRFIADNFSVYLQDMGRLAITEPGARERATLNQGLKTDTPLGAVLALATQYWSFPLTSKRVLQRVAGSDPTNRFNVGAIGALVGSTMAYAYLGDSLISFAGNKTPKDPTDPNTFVEMLQRSGSMGIYADFLMADYSKHYVDLSKMLTGPTIGTVGDAASLIRKGLKGDARSGETFNFVLNHTPFVNTFYLRGILDYSVLDPIQEYLTPGYMRKKRNKLQKQGRSAIIE